MNGLVFRQVEVCCAVSVVKLRRQHKKAPPSIPLDGATTKIP
jgi:hypothetical protein